MLFIAFYFIIEVQAGQQRNQNTTGGGGGGSGQNWSMY